MLSKSYIKKVGKKVKIKNKTMPVKVLVETRDENKVVTLDLTVKRLRDLLEGELKFIDLEYSRYSKKNKIDYLVKSDWENAYISTKKIASLSFDEKLYDIMSTIYDIEDILDKVDNTQMIKEKMNKKVLENTLEEKYKEYIKYTKQS